MSKLLKILHPDVTHYRDRRFDGTEEDWEHAISSSTTVYVGNLGFTSREEQVFDVFTRVGHIKRIIMGLDKTRRTPCGFCFVIFFNRKDAEDAVTFLNGTKLDGRPIRVDIDWGFVEGRQFGRGRSGGQVRDEFRQDFDEGRGGFGKIVLEMQQMQQMQVMGLEGEAQFGYAPGSSYSSGRPGKRGRFGQGGIGGQGSFGGAGDGQGQGFEGDQQQQMLPPPPEENPRFRRESDDEGGE